ncbi:MAG: hypothetical protein EB103_02930 [Actinobacteria bacterium]|nr:hypothetical protein [Actinomycetota bacterium]
MTIEVLATGLTLIQDAGRDGYTNIGVSRSGAWDDLSYRLISNLVGETNPAVFEVIAGTFSLKTSKQVIVAVVGCGLIRANGIPISTNSCFLLEGNNVLEVEPNGDGPVYLAIAGIQIPKILDSVAQDTLSGLGPEALIANQVFEVDDAVREDFRVGSFIQAYPKTDKTVIRYLAGQDPQNILGKYLVQANSRTGIRLSVGENLSSIATLPSFPVMPGVIQLTPSGEPVILGCDCGTTGGYSATGVVISADLHKLSRLRSGDNLLLQKVSIDEARTLLSEQQQSIRKAVIRPSEMGAW